jgi:hypothetical protein
MSVQRSLVAVALVALSMVALTLTAPRMLSNDSPPPDSPAGAGAGAGGALEEANGASTGAKGDSTAADPTPFPSSGSQASGHARKRPGTPAEAAPTTTATATPYALPGLKPPPAHLAPLLTGPLPKPAQAQDALAVGYPGTVLPAAPRSRITSSSVSPSGDRLQVTLTAVRAGDVDAVLRFYRLALTRSGLTEVPVQAVGGSQAAAFQRGGSSVVVTVTPGSTTTYTVFATLAASGA